jgi:hypothetical protein
VELASQSLQQTVAKSAWGGSGTFAGVSPRDTGSVTVSAPRIDARLLAALTRLDDESRPIADLHRRLGEVADWLGVPRPSYEQVRVIAKANRRMPIYAGIGEVLLEIAFRSRPPEALLDLLSGTAGPKRRK